MPTRREILKWMALAAVSPALGAADDTLAALDAAAQRILPSDDGPGAREAHVGTFLQRQLEGDLREARPAFDRIVQLLNQRTAGFLKATASAQDEALQWFAHAAPPFFLAFHTLVLEGFLSDPKHGGNFEGIGWRAIGFDGHHH